MSFCPHFLKSKVQTFLIFGILGEKYWKKVVSHLNIFANKGCKIAAQKKDHFPHGGGTNFFGVCSDLDIWCAIVWSGPLWFGIVWSGPLWFAIVRCYVVWCRVVLYSEV